MGKIGIMGQKMVKVPKSDLNAIEKHCKDETAKRGQFYSVSQFFREAGIEKLSKLKAKRVDRMG